MTVLWDSLLIGIGLVCGMVFAFGAVLLWTAVAGPLQEWLCEVTLDRLHRHRSDRPLIPEKSGKFSVLVSDIHLDTWGYPADPKPAAFIEFLDWVRREERVKNLYVNGDLMDLPPHPLNQPIVPILHVKSGDPDDYPALDSFPGLGVLNPNFDAVLFALGTLGKPVTFVVGNHDIGVYGIRYIRPTLAWSSVRVAWNPSLLLEATPERRIYIEHGHHYDPFLWIYLRYAALELLQGPGASAQRGGKVGMSKHARERSVPQSDPPGPLYFEGPGDVEPPLGEGFLPRMARYRFRQAARRLFRTVKLEDRESVKVVTMGHTHLPDRYEFPGGKLYVNSGDWAGNDIHRCFVLIHPNGEVSGPHQWRGEFDWDAVVPASG